ncbi:MAG: hypothetical protein R2780_11955 [Crocinitomicaceae bacterium]|nr:hypothetical protein [Crocinitomicaceae bacterium]
MKKVRVMLLGIVFVGMSSCATMLENMKVNCDDERTSPNSCENFEFNCDSNCE